MRFSSDLDRSCNPGQDTLHWNRRNCVSTSQVALRDSLKSILHAGYPRLNRFIGDYSSAFRKKDRRNEDWKYPILPEASKKLALLSLLSLMFFLLFREWHASHYRKERIIEPAYTCVPMYMLLLICQSCHYLSTKCIARWYRISDTHARGFNEG